jgi:hypothetical protein
MVSDVAAVPHAERPSAAATPAIQYLRNAYSHLEKIALPPQSP